MNVASKIDSNTVASLCLFSTLANTLSPTRRDFGDKIALTVTRRVQMPVKNETFWTGRHELWVLLYNEFGR